MTRSTVPPTTPPTSPPAGRPASHVDAAEVPSTAADRTAPVACRPDPEASHTAAVTFRMFASARAAAGTAEVHTAPGPTSQVVAALTAGLPPRFAEVLAASSLLADGVRLDRTSTAGIPGGTVVDVLPPFAGG